MTKPVLFIRPKSRGHRVVCDSKENGNAWDFFDKRKLRCRVDQAQRIHRAEYRLWSTLNGLVDPALRALIHPTTTHPADAPFRGIPQAVELALRPHASLGKAQRNGESTRRLLAEGIEEVKLTRLGRDPNLVGASLEISVRLFRDFGFCVQRRDNFHANLRRAWEYFGASMSLHKGLRCPSDVRYAQADFGQHWAPGEHHPLRKFAPQLSGDIRLDTCASSPSGRQFDFSPGVELDLVRQISQAHIMQHFYPSQDQRFAGYKTYHKIGLKMRASDLGKYTRTNDHSSVRCAFGARPR